MSEAEQAPVVVTDLALAKIAAQVASTTPGVARLAPTITRVVKSALTRAARSIANLENGPVAAGEADPGAIEIDRPDGSPIVLTVRIVANGEPPVLDTVNAIQFGVQETVRQLASLQVDVAVLVVDTEPTGLTPTAEIVTAGM